MLQILTGETPFVKKKSQYALILAVRAGVQPEDMYKEAEYSTTWEVVKPCINVQPTSRPIMGEVVRHLPQTRA
jgi:hypothetical protein